MNVKVEYNISAEMAEKILIGLRTEAHRKAEEKIAKANAFRDGYVTAIMDVQDRVIRYYTANASGVKED